MISRLLISHDIVEATERALRDAGAQGHELFVLWSGRMEADTFGAETYHVPPQVAYRTEHGCGVRVDGAALHELNVWLYAHQEMLGVQVHTHPTHAFHSDTDDAYPIVTAEGGISIVVADFALDGLMADSTAIYRLEAGTWRPFPLALEIT